MSNDSSYTEITKAMETPLQEVRNYPFLARERTFFSVEGIIGRYENPTSDLLRFFMSQDEGHDLGPLFLRAFFACLNEDTISLRFEHVQVLTRVKTDGGKYPDFVITSRDWVLVIENKISAQNGNLLEDYEKHAKKFSGKPQHFAILSPDGRGAPGWKAVSYQNYCNALKSELAKVSFDRPISKWQVFAREFILHLEQKLYNLPMSLTNEQKAFVEEHFKEIGDIVKLSVGYTQDLLRELSDRFRKEFPGANDFQDQRWALDCYVSVGNLTLQFIFQTPAHEDGNPERMYRIRAWVKGLMEAQRLNASDLLERTPPCQEEGGEWVGERRGIASRPEAIDALCSLANELFGLWGNEASPAPLVQVTV